MKILITLLIALTSFSLKANPKCQWSDTSVEFNASTWALTPETFYAKEGDRVCVKFKSLDNPKSLRIQGMPIYMHASPKDREIQEAMIIVRKKGEFRVICGGCTKEAKIIVQDKQSFERMQKKLDHIRSFENRNPHNF